MVLSETGALNGEVSAGRIIVGGKVEGSLRAQEIVEIKDTGKVQGEIFANKFTVMEGGEFNGKIEMKTHEIKALDFETKGSISSRRPQFNIFLIFVEIGS